MDSVKLMYHTPIDVIAQAIGTCTEREIEDHEKSIKHCIDNGHGSVLEHVYYTFYIEGLSRAALQELARHRVASFSVKSTRYTLKKLQNMSTIELKNSLVKTGNFFIDNLNIITLKDLANLLRRKKIANDIAKYALPEAFKTTVQFTINVRSLRNFIDLRSSKRALWEMRDLAKDIYNIIPKTHKFMYEGVYHYE